MDDRLHKARILMESLAEGVRQGCLLKKHGPPQASYWARAGVLFTTEILDPEENRDERRSAPVTVLTPHAPEAGLILDSLHEIFEPLLDECIEGEFYERLAEAALEYSGYVKIEDATSINLMKVLLTEAEDILEEMREGEFPYTL